MGLLLPEGIEGQMNIFDFTGFNAPKKRDAVICTNPNEYMVCYDMIWKTHECKRAENCKEHNYPYYKCPYMEKGVIE